MQFIDGSALKMSNIASHFGRPCDCLRTRARDCSGKPEVSRLVWWADLERKARWPCVSLGHAPKIATRF
jgi:hypothetical protein